MAPLKISLKQQFMLVVLLLLLLPIMVFKFSLDVQNQELKNQMSNDLQSAKALSLLLTATHNSLSETSTETWAKQLTFLDQTLNLDSEHQTIWLLNDQGQVFYVYGDLTPRLSLGLYGLWQRFLLRWQPIIQQTPRVQDDAFDQLIEDSLSGQTVQAIRQEGLFPASLMTSTPLQLADAEGTSHLGVIIFEQTLTTLIDRSIGGLFAFLLALMILLVIWGLVVIALAAHVSWRIGRLQQALKKGVVSLKTYNQACYQPPLLPINDEIQQLNDDITQLFKQISDYQRYLASLPSTLNHELHNPLNRLNLALARLPIDAAQKQPFEQAIAQITDITQRLTEAQNLKASIANTQLQRTNLVPRLNDYFSQVIDYIGQDKVIYQPFQAQTAWVMADSFLIEQLFDKLIDNAVAFNADPAPIRISCELTVREHHDVALVVRICNQGPAWPTHVDPRTEFFSMRESFDKISTSHNADHLDTDKPHLGLGLHLADLIAKRHNGHLLLTDYITTSSSHSKDPIGVCVALVLPRLRL